MKWLTLTLLAYLWLPALAYGQGQTIDALTPGAALSGAEAFPMFQSANPAVKTGPRAITNYYHSISNSIDATQYPGSDACAQVVAAAAALATAAPKGGKVDARGFSSSSAFQCAASIYGGFASTGQWTLELGGTFWLSTQVAQTQPANVMVVGPNGTAPLQPAYFISTTGNDSTGTGTFAAPWATMTKCQTQMNAGAVVKTCYLRAGTYTPADDSSGSGCFWGFSGTCAVNMTAADSGQKWATYPLDTCTTAIIDGQSTGVGVGKTVIFSNNGAANVTWNCLTMKKFQYASVASINNYGNTAGPAGLVFSNNIVSDGFDDPGGTSASCGGGFCSNAGGIMCTNCTDMLVSHNAIHDVVGFGVSVGNQNGFVNSGIAYDSNVMYNTCTATTSNDCGAAYLVDQNSHQGTISGFNTITHNFLYDTNPNTAGTGNFGGAIYADDCASNVLISGNIVFGKSGSQSTLIHGGSNVISTGNIFDLSNFTRPITQLTISGDCTPGIGSSFMTGNMYQGNVIISKGGGGGYFGATITAPAAQPLIGGTGKSTQTGQGNLYFNYGGSAISSSGTGGVTVNDLNPTTADPQLSGCFSMAPSSPAVISPINFKLIPGGWGPPGFAIPASSGSSVPSYGSPTC